MKIIVQSCQYASKGSKSNNAEELCNQYLQRDVLLGGLVELGGLEGDLQAGQLGGGRGGSAGRTVAIAVATASAATLLGLRLGLQLLGSLAHLLLHLGLGCLVVLGQATALYGKIVIVHEMLLDTKMYRLPGRWQQHASPEQLQHSEQPL